MSIEHPLLDQQQAALTAQYNTQRFKERNPVTTTFSTQPTIVGAGLAGLIAAHAWPRARVLEAAPEPRAVHRALLRFRSEAVAQLTGVEFRRVQVRKSIWARGTHVAPDIALANAYAQKCLGRMIGDRSIWKLEPAERWVAPETLYEQLIQAVGARITWGATVDFRTERAPLVSTAPMPVALQSCGIPHDRAAFERSPITVTRWRVPRADVYQTVYFPEPATALYRASITGSLLITEFVRQPVGSELDECMAEVERAFGLTAELERLDSVQQSYGKIAPIDDAQRKNFMFRLTHDHGVYSLGRFATWRNILLDDVVHDISVVKKLLKSNAYELRRSAA